MKTEVSHRMHIESVILRDLKWLILGGDICTVGADSLLSPDAMSMFSPVLVLQKIQASGYLVRLKDFVGSCIYCT